jgi:hypothetical protein
LTILPPERKEITIGLGGPFSGFLLLAPSCRAHITGDSGLAGPWVLDKLGVPVQKTWVIVLAEKVKYIASALYIPALKDGAFRECPVKPLSRSK